MDLVNTVNTVDTVDGWTKWTGGRWEADGTIVRGKVAVVAISRLPAAKDLLAMKSRAFFTHPLVKNVERVYKGRCRAMCRGER